MSRQLRIEFAGACYHAFGRGNARQDVFLSPADFDGFLDLLGETCLRFDWHCHAHCLMPNHYHLLIQTRGPTLSAGMRHLIGVYTQRFNRRHRRVGHLFQGRFKALLVQDERYLLELARYIVLNPVRAKLVDDVAGWRWSSFAWSVGKRAAPAWASPDPLLRRLDADPNRAARVFTRFLSLAHETPAIGWSQDGVLGDGGFKKSQRTRVQPHGQAVEIPLAMRVVHRPPLPELLPEVRPRASVELDARIEVAVVRWRYSQQEVADRLGVSRATVARALHRARMSQ